MNQLCLGASIPFAAAALLWALRSGRCSLRMLVLTPVLMAAGAAWAVLPDVPRLLGWQALYERMAADPRIDIFFWHYRIDAAEADSPLYAALCAAMALALLAAAWRELALREGGR